MARKGQEGPKQAQIRLSGELTILTLRPAVRIAVRVCIAKEEAVTS
ncbi:MAG: hypothetical protein GF363_01055 [Chitinivibrionales bacterium]|nr:hypothetical protein [Chitinivibrionales bacterium]